MTRSAFGKTWGAEPVGNGDWRFRLWAPGRDRVDLTLDDQTHDMARAGDGWFETEVAALEGQQYGFALGNGARIADPGSLSMPAISSMVCRWNRPFISCNCTL